MRPLAVVVLAAAIGVPSAQAATCESGSIVAGTTVEICIDAPASGASTSGDVVVALHATVTGTPVTRPRMFIRLDGQTLITDYEEPYGFTLPTRRFADGMHTLEATLRSPSAAVSPSVTIPLTIANGVPPIGANTTPFSPRGSPATRQVVAVLGDAAGGTQPSAVVASLVRRWDPDRVLYLGDVYNSGTIVEYANWVGGPGGPFLGTFRDITNPVIGNHEYASGGAGYDDYWGPGARRYTFELGGWRFVAADSNCAQQPCAAGTDGYRWLDERLTQRAADCVVLLQHHPRFSFGPQASSAPMVATDPLWRLAVRHGVEVVLTGHEHSYQRFVPLDGDGGAGNGGPVEVIAGTGGHDKQALSPADARLAFGLSEYGAVRMVVAPGSVEFEFVDVAGVVRDHATYACAAARSPVDPTATATAEVGSRGSVQIAGAITGHGEEGTWSLSLRAGDREPATGTFAASGASPVAATATALQPGTYDARLVARRSPATLPVEIAIEFTIPAVRPRFVARPRVVITRAAGRVVARCVARVRSSSWPVPTVRYAWFRAGSRLQARRRALVIGPRLRGRPIVCQVTARSSAGVRRARSKPVVVRKAQRTSAVPADRRGRAASAPAS